MWRVKRVSTLQWICQQFRRCRPKWLSQVIFHRSEWSCNRCLFMIIFQVLFLLRQTRSAIWTHLRRWKALQSVVVVVRLSAKRSDLLGEQASINTSIDLWFQSIPPTYRTTFHCWTRNNPEHIALYTNKYHRIYLQTKEKHLQMSFASMLPMAPWLPIRNHADIISNAMANTR